MCKPETCGDCSHWHRIGNTTKGECSTPLPFWALLDLDDGVSSGMTTEEQTAAGYLDEKETRADECVFFSRL